MKICIAILGLSIFSTTAFAKSQTLSDINKITASAEVEKFLTENNLKVRGIDVDMTAYCAGGPTNFKIRATNQERKSCEVWVKIGECNGDELREKVALLTSSTDLDCH